MSVRFGVLFSGAGMYAATQLGVLRALEEKRMAPSALVGIGAGAWVAGLYACQPDARQVYAAAREVCRLGRRLIDPDRRTWLWMAGNGGRGLVKGERIAALLEEQTGRRGLSELAMPLAIPVVALPTRRTLVFANHCPKDHGDMVWTQQAPVALAIRAALAAPVLVRPALWMGTPLVGTASLGTAATVLRHLCAKHALVVDAGAQRPRGRLGIWEMAALSAGLQEGTPAYPPNWRVLSPQVPQNVRPDSLDALDVCEGIGYEAAMEAMPYIRAATGAGPGKILPFQQPGLLR